MNKSELDYKLELYKNLSERELDLINQIFECIETDEELDYALFTIEHNTQNITNILKQIITNKQNEIALHALELKNDAIDNEVFSNEELMNDEVFNFINIVNDSKSEKELILEEIMSALIYRKTNNDYYIEKNDLVNLIENRIKILRNSEEVNRQEIFSFITEMTKNKIIKDVTQVFDKNCYIVSKV